jgi:hypothetical protein
VDISEGFCAGRLNFVLVKRTSIVAVRVFVDVWLSATKKKCHFSKNLSTNESVHGLPIDMKKSARISLRKFGSPFMTDILVLV